MFLALSSIVNWGIYYVKRTIVSTIITFVGAIVNISICLILIPKLGSVGAALASVTSGLIILLMTVYAMRKLFSAPINYQRIIYAICLGIAIMVMTQVLVSNVGGLSYAFKQVIKAGAIMLYFVGVKFYVIGTNSTVLRELCTHMRSFKA
jgi:O-antigen/teichoic acid export membrane protein